MSLNINAFDSNSINTLFSGMPKNKNASFTGIEGLLSDYHTLQSGSYQRLLKSYYDKFGTDNSTKGTVKAKDSAEYSSIEKTAEGVADSIKPLLDKSSNLWKQSSIKDDDGNEKFDYDKDAIYSALSDFVDSYNNLVDSGQKSSNTGILTQVAGMVQTSSSTATTLGKVGITIDSKNHLSINEDFFKNKADMTTVKSLFNGNGSYAYSVSSKASMVKNYANNALSNLTGKKSYTNTGEFDLSAGDIVSSFNIST